MKVNRANALNIVVTVIKLNSEGIFSIVGTFNEVNAFKLFTI